MSIQTQQATLRITGEVAGQVDGLNLTLNSSLILGFNCAPLSIGKSNTMMGYNAALNARIGSKNVVYGYEAALNMNGDDNVYIGTRSAVNATVSHGNTIVGTDAAPQLLTGSCNVMVGMRADARDIADSGVVAVGFGARAGQGSGATAVGSLSSAAGQQALAVGHGVRSSGPGTFNIANRVRGSYANGAALSNDTYTVQVDADVTKITGALAHCYPGSNAVPQWLTYIDTSKTQVSEGRSYADLVVKSANYACIRFRDEFYPGIFNFTAQHRCVYTTDVKSDSGLQTDVSGLVVVATGEYCGLDGAVGPIAMDEAIPVVALARDERDPRAFGVVQAFEPMADVREFRLGNMVFEAPRRAEERRVVVNVLGEGAIWVTDANGPLKNGDLLTTSALPGLAMRQGSDALHSWSVAKVTCDCDFSESEGLPSSWFGVPVPAGARRALVGCTYRF
jgi:hypothetical protein